MALYTLKNRDEVMNSLTNYGGDNSWVRNQLASFGYRPSEAQTEMYDTLGRNASTGSSDDNFFTKRWKSIDNAVGTTGASITAGLDNAIETQNIENRLNKWNNNINDIYKKYGYENEDAYYDAKNAAEAETFGKYGFDADNYWNKHAELYSPSGDNAEALKALEDERSSVINKMSQEDADKIRRFDSIQNELINQSSANSKEAKEASDNWRDYRENSDVSKRINQDRGKFLGSAINTLSTATDLAGLTNGPLANAIQGGIEGIADELEQNGLENFDWGRAGQNALTGAASGAVTGAMNQGISNQLAQQGGNLFKGANRFTGWLNDATSKGLGKGLATLASGIGRGALSGAVGGATGSGVSSAINGVDLGQGIANTFQGAVQGAKQGALAGGVMAGANMAIDATPGIGNAMRSINQASADWQNSGDTFGERWRNTRSQDTWGNRFLDNQVENAKAVGQGFKNVGEGVKALADNARRVMGDQNGNAFDRYKESMPNENASYINTAHLMSGDEAIRGVPTSNGKTATAEDFAFNRTSNADANSSIPQTEQNVNALPRDIQNMRINEPQTEVYRTLTGDSKNTTSSDLMYGESELGNRTRRGMVADSLERLGNTLEGAQTNVTRAAAKDLGIESTGKVVENVRKKTGITNLETQARLAKELTGGDNSLMDNIQRQALNASENGQSYKVDTTPVLDEVDSIVDKYADTNMFGSQNARNKFISNLKRDISNFDSDVLSIANRMKANAADLRGKGVTSPTPADSAKAKIYTEVANKLDDLSYKAIPQDNVDAMFDATISEMRGRANQAKQNGNNDIAKAYNKLADSLDAEPRTIKAYRSFKKDFVDTSKISELTNRAENGAAAQMGRSFGGGAKRFLGTVAQRPVNAALAKAGGVINNIADKVAGDSTPTTSGTTTQTATSTGYNPATQVYNAIGRTEGAINADNTRAASYISEAAQDANTLEDLAAPANTTSSTSVYNSVYGNSNGSTPTFASREEERAVYFFPPTGNARSDMLSRALRRAKNAEDYGAMDTLYSMYLDAVEKQEKISASQTKLTDKQRQANAAARALQDFENAEPNFAYDVSDIPLIGGIANLGGNEYASKAEALALQVGYMLSGATVNKEEAKNIGMAYVPQPRDSEAVRKSKLAQLRGIISDYQQTYGE